MIPRVNDRGGCMVHGITDGSSHLRSLLGVSCISTPTLN